MVYVNDINIGSKSFGEHLNHLKQVFERFRQNGLKLSPEKCFFFNTKLPFLGHIIGREGIQTDP